MTLWARKKPSYAAINADLFLRRVFFKIRARGSKLSALNFWKRAFLSNCTHVNVIYVHAKSKRQSQKCITEVVKLCHLLRICVGSGAVHRNAMKTWGPIPSINRQKGVAVWCTFHLGLLQTKYWTKQRILPVPYRTKWWHRQTNSTSHRHSPLKEPRKKPELVCIKKLFYTLRI